MILKSNLFKEKEFEVVHQTDNFYVGVIKDVSPLLVLDEIPNYFIFNTQTAKIEAMSNSLAAAKAFTAFAENDDEIEFEPSGELKGPPRLN